MGTTTAHAVRRIREILESSGNEEYGNLVADVIAEATGAAATRLEDYAKRDEDDLEAYLAGLHIA